MFHVEHTAPHPHPHVGKPLTPTTFRGCFFGWTVSHKIFVRIFHSTSKPPPSPPSPNTHRQQTRLPSNTNSKHVFKQAHSTNKTPPPIMAANKAFPSLKINISFKSKLKKFSRKNWQLCIIEL